MKEDLPSQDHIVSFPMLTILTGQGHISKVVVVAQIFKKLNLLTHTGQTSLKKCNQSVWFGIDRTPVIPRSDKKWVVFDCNQGGLGCFWLQSWAGWIVGRLPLSSFGKKTGTTSLLAWHPVSLPLLCSCGNIFENAHWRKVIWKCTVETLQQINRVSFKSNHEMGILKIKDEVFLINRVSCKSS